MNDEPDQAPLPYRVLTLAVIIGAAFAVGTHIFQVHSGDPDWSWPAVMMFPIGFATFCANSISGSTLMTYDLRPMAPAF